MSTANTGPPDKRVKPGNHDAAEPHHKTGTFQSQQPAPAYSTTRRQCADALGRRRAASYRLPVLESGRSDPWWCEPPGPRGYEQAALHLLERGLLPAANREGLQVMRDRQAAQRIAQAWGLAA